ncbi:lysophosphatidic acid phosphatase type 6 isoform X1 [Salmo salar]|uniref:Lysophosphatidic acid phosphatase type 6 n=1 Tax=Salmo salar TaxID=8030 RepID=B5X0X7_SALSA|nr:Lysophosphatidic acid phosphatase type 6 [Salmo salar]XP_045560280.1 lysophosphatidic acid phosphatase type 6 isoform X1 [Salmo salar]ACI32958.1 Lysophosphatidic acid phosphatase type 6 precursor [Salmo salar]|eukprot:NP_001133278.1 Lysophosphatidic acid phosphatase type 6 [Salmo salar]
MRTRNLWTKAGVLGSVSMAFGSMLWSHKKTEPTQTDSGSDRTCTEPPFPYELKLVQVLFRHGARTPLKSIPGIMEAQWVPNLLEPPAHTQINYVVTDLEGGPRPPSPVEDSYRANILTGGTYPGQLTTVGMQQLYELGERLRKRYIQDTAFLNPTFSPTEVYVRSTNIVRTIESAKCLVAGLFYQSQRDMVPILTTEAESEILYPNYHGCRLLKLLSGHRWAESSTLPDIAADLSSIKSALGIAAQQRVDFILIRDDMVARETHGLPCPPVLDSWRNTVERRAVEMIYHIYEPSKRENLQLCVGPLLHILMGNIEDKLQDTTSEPNRKLFLYSAHDTTLIPCLMALGIFDMRWPPYASDITLELHQHRQTKEAFVKVSYIGQDQLVPGCSGVYCPLQEFKQALSNYSLTFELYESLCNRTKGVADP